MENASKALIMAAGILIGVLILTLAMYLFITFGQSSSEIHDRMYDNQLTQYNAQYTIYSGRDDITIYEIISVANLAHNNNDKYKDYTGFEEEYKVTVNLDGYPNLQEDIGEKSQELLSKYTNIIDLNQTIDTNDTQRSYLATTFICTRIEYNEAWRVKLIKFTENRNIK